MFGLGDFISEPAALGLSSVEHAAAAIRVPKTSGEWSDAIDRLRTQRGWDDAELCRVIRITPELLAKCRSDMRAPRPAQCLRILAALGFPLSIELLLGVLPQSIQVAASDIDFANFSLKSNVVDQFFDDIDLAADGHGAQQDFLVRLRAVTRESIDQLAASIGLTQREWELSCAGQARLPFRAKRAIVARFGTETLFRIIVELKSV